MFPNMNNLSPVEQAAVKWQYNLYGGFYTSLWQAIVTADEEHLKQLSLGFPIEVEAYRRFSKEAGWWKKVQAKLFDNNQTH